MGVPVAALSAVWNGVRCAPSAVSCRCCSLPIGAFSSTSTITNLRRSSQTFVVTGEINDRNEVHTQASGTVNAVAPRETAQWQLSATVGLNGTTCHLVAITG